MASTKVGKWLVVVAVVELGTVASSIAARGGEAYKQRLPMNVKETIAASDASRAHRSNRILATGAKLAKHVRPHKRFAVAVLILSTLSILVNERRMFLQHVCVCVIRWELWECVNQPVP